MICENCQQTHDGSYTSGRFCSSKCARSFATKAKRLEINQKVSISLTGRRGNPENARYMNTPEAREHANTVIRAQMKQRFETLSFNELGPNLKRRRILLEQHHKCAVCRCESIHNDRPLKFQLDHINGIREDNSRDNLRLVCPNCHSQTPTWGARNAKDDARIRMRLGGSKGGSKKRRS